MSAATVTLLLPSAARFGRHRVDDGLLAALGRADRALPAGSGRRAQLLRQFEVSPAGWPLAALTRTTDVGDAGAACWLRADPAYVRPDSNGARLMAWGPGLVPDAEDVNALLPDLQALFAEAGIALDAPTPAHWYLRLPRDEALPDFDDPEAALGEDLFEHQPEGATGRRWRGLLSDAQVLLHNHPWNALRTARGKPPINALWFWGGGVVPDHVRALRATICSDDETTRALAAAGGSQVEDLPQAGLHDAPGAVMFDLCTLRDPSSLAQAWLQPALMSLRRGRVRRLEFDFEDGRVYAMEAHHRWRLWRKPLSSLQA